MPFALMLRKGSWSLLETKLRELNAAKIHHRGGTDVRFIAPLSTAKPSQVRALVFVEYKPSVTETTLDHSTVFDSLLALDRSGFWVEHTRERIERFLAWLALIGLYRLRYAKLEEAEKAVTSLANN